jgi:adenylate kinase family enzyme
MGSRGLGRRIVVVGSTGAGKTTLAEALSTRLTIPHVELDALHWEAGWAPASTPEFRARVSEALAGDDWVVDGNYQSVRDLVWPRAQAMVWLDYSLPVIMWRLTRRSAHRLRTRHELWNGNREQLGMLFSRESLFVWALKTHGKRRREYPAFLQEPEHRHLTVVRLCSPLEAEKWLTTGYSRYV